MSSAFRGERLHIAVLGRCNTGKSTILNRLAGQEAAIVSPEPGTTGDPVPLAFELLPLGPVTFYDTAGVDEESVLGILRREAGRKVLARADMALVVTDERGIGPWEEDIIAALRNLETPFLVVFNKQDKFGQDKFGQDRHGRNAGNRDEAEAAPRGNGREAAGSGGGAAGAASGLARAGVSRTGLPRTGMAYAGMQWCEREGLPFLALAAERLEDPAPLREAVMQLAPAKGVKKPLVADMLAPGAPVLCVTPIDASAPAGRLIAPQVQVLRELIEAGHPAMAVQPAGLPRALALLNEAPALVIADSQVVREVAAALPPAVPLTTFSVVFARQKGDFSLLLEGARSIDTLLPGSRVLIAEACAHHAQDDDIARVKIPALLRKRLGHSLEFSFSSGGDFPADLGEYALAIHCGGCMLNPGEMRRRQRLCAAAGVPATNFGMAISVVQNLLDRVAAPFAG